MNGKVKVSDKVKRGLLIGMAIGALAMSSIACDDGGDVAYEVIQNGQNTIQEAGQAVKNSDLNESLTFEEIWEAIP